MAEYAVKLPDVGEGIAEAELVEWSVAVGDMVREDAVLAAVMTDKATVEVPSPVQGKVIWLGGEVGQQIAIGSVLVRIEVPGDGESAAAAPAAPEENDAAPEAAKQEAAAPALAAAGKRAIPASGGVASRSSSERPLAAPSVRQHAREHDIDLASVQGTGPGGRITHGDIEAYLEAGRAAPVRRAAPANATREKRITGLRRRIAERMAEAKRRIPHITIVEEVDVTALEALREQLNANRREERPKLTVLPFIMAAIARAVKEQPVINAHYDDGAELVTEYDAVHIGIATQTKAGLMVPVVRHCESLSLWDTASEVLRLAAAARDSKATREELSGSTITISSLGPLGAIATTPIINLPEVAIVGINRMEVRPHWDGSQFVPRKMMNLSSSFDHRIIDGWDAATFVQRLKTLLETPALIFLER